MGATITLPTKGLPFEAQLLITKHSFEGTKFFVEGYVSTTDYDLQGHVVSMEAIRGSKDDLLENSTFLYNHDPNRPIGRTVMTKFNSKGLFVRVEISSTEIELREKIREGVLNKFSIRGRVLDAVDEKDADGVETKVIKRMYLTEASLVSVPANTNAEVVRWWETEKSLLGGIVKSLNDYHEEGGDRKMKNENASKEEITKAWMEHIAEAGLEKSSAEELDTEFQSFCKANGYPDGERPDMAAVISLVDKLLEGEEDEGKKALLMELKQMLGASEEEAEPEAEAEPTADAVEVEVQESEEAAKAGADTELDENGKPKEGDVKKEGEEAPAEEAAPTAGEPAAVEAAPAEEVKKSTTELEKENAELKKQLGDKPNARKGVVPVGAGNSGMDKFREAPPINRAVAGAAVLFGHKSTGR